MTLNRMYWVIYLFSNNTFLWQPAKPKYGNYRLRGYNNRSRKMMK